MRIARRKKSYCQNCEYPLLENYNFCPNCGQENTEKLVSFGTLVSEFFSNYIAYDSKLARTIRPFLLQPGFLTNAFNSGQRVKYMHPLRLYFIVTFFYFFVLTLVIKQETDTFSGGSNNKSTSSVREENVDNTAPGINITTNPDSLKRKDNLTTIFDKSFSTDFLSNERTTDAQVVDSLGWKQTVVNRYVAKQVIKFARSDAKSIGTYFSDYMLNKASILMFFMLPLFALLLKLVYICHKRFFVEHLTFSLHIHSFVFFILLVQVLIDTVLIDAIFKNEWTGTVAFFTIFIYGVISARQVYRQKWIKTLLKGWMLFAGYTLCFALLAFIGIIIGGLIY